jgi:hypothetical protein
MSVYLYVGGNPLAHADPSGYKRHLLIKNIFLKHVPILGDFHGDLYWDDENNAFWLDGPAKKNYFLEIDVYASLKGKGVRYE